MQFNFVALFKAAPIMTPLLMFGAMMGMLFVVTALRNSAWGVAALFGFTFVVGRDADADPARSRPASATAASWSALAGGMTAAIFFAMATIATVTKRDFSFLGKFLFVGLILLIVASLANLFFQIPALSLTISAIAVLIFSAYLLYDISRIVHGGETNYVMATLALFLDLYNIFISLLNLLMAFTGDSATERSRPYPDENGGLRAALFISACRLSGPRCAALLSGRTRAIDSTCAVCGNMLTMPAAAQRVAVLVHQHRRVAGQRRRIARHVDDAPRRRPSPGSALTSGDRAFARRIDQHACRAGPAPRRSPAWPRTGWRRRNASAAARPLRAAFAAARAHQRGAAFDADDVRAAARDRQREVAEAAEEVGDALARLRMRAGASRAAPARG